MTVPLKVEKKTIRVNQNDYLVEIITVGDWKAKKLVGFSQGYLAHPLFYKEFLEGIAKNDAFVVAPSINGVRVKNKNGHLKSFDNSTFRSCQEIVGNSLELSLIDSRINHGYDLLIGHSTGAASVQSERLEYLRTVLINPLMPVTYNVRGFFYGSIKISLNQLKSGSIKALRHLFNPKVKVFCTMHALANLKNNFTLIEDFVKNGSLDYFYPVKKKTEALLLYGGDLENEKDEFFEFGRNKEFLKEQFKTLSFNGMKGGHEELIYNPSFFIKKTLEFLG